MVSERDTTPRNTIEKELEKKGEQNCKAILMQRFEGSRVDYDFQYTVTSRWYTGLINGLAAATPMLMTASLGKISSTGAGLTNQ